MAILEKLSPPQSSFYYFVYIFLAYILVEIGVFILKRGAK